MTLVGKGFLNFNFSCHWKWKLLDYVRLFATPWIIYSPRNSPGQNTGVGSPSLLQRIFQTQGSNPGLPHCRRILYQLNHRGSHNGEQFKVRKSVRSHFLPGSIHRFLAIKKGCLFLVVISTQNKQKNYKPPSGRFLPLCGCQWQVSLSNQLCSYNYRFGG